MFSSLCPNRSSRQNNIDLLLNQIIGQFRKPGKIAFSPSVFDDDILSFNATRSLQSVPKRSEGKSVRCRRASHKPSHTRDFRLLSVPAMRPNNGAPQHNEKFAPPHAPSPGLRPLTSV